MRYRFVLTAPLVIGLVLLSAISVRAEIIISEIMYNPAGTDFQTGADPFNKEWIELYNSGDSPVHLVGWAFGDSQDGDWASAFPWGTWLGPQQALVVTGDTTTFDTQWGPGINRIQVANFPTLANTPSSSNETAALRDAFGVTRDEVNISQGGAWPWIDGTQGASVYLRPEGLSAAANDLGTNWAPSAWGAYDAVFRNVGGEINHASPGYVATVPQDPFAPSPDAAWSMVVIPDTQNYAKSSTHAPGFTQMTEWIRDNREAFNIQLVLHEGDIVNNNNTNNPTSGNQTSTQQWQNAQTSMHLLNGQVPYVMAAGNHDYGTTNAQNRQTFFNDYFRATDNPLVDPAQGGILSGVMNAGELQNAYFDFTAPDGRKLLILALEWEPRPETVAWANEVVSRTEYAEHTAVLLTHAYLTGTNSRYSASGVPEDASGAELWTDLVRGNQNFEMTFNGHFGGDGAGYLGSAVSGHVVHQMFFNTQFETQGGNGWLRAIEFLEDGTTVRVRTYSPILDLVRTDNEWAFEFQISALPAQILLGDYNLDGVVDAADYVVWRDSMGSTDQLAADGDGDGTVNQGDYLIWKQNFGATLGGPGFGQLNAAVPEPTCIALLLVFGALAMIRKRTMNSTSTVSIL